MKAPRPVCPGALAAPALPTQSSAQTPAFPRQFEVLGPEADTVGFAVTQPGPVVVEVRAQGPPLVVAVQSAGRKPIAQQGAGNVQVRFDVTSDDIQKSLFWTVQIRLARPMPPQQGGRAVGTVDVQLPPVDQAAVTPALQGMAARTPSAPQALPTTSAQIEQAFRQRQAQLDGQQQQRRDALFAQIRPQVDRLQSLVAQGAAVQTRGLDRAPAATHPPAFPQKFNVKGPEADSFGFAVTQPGLVQVDVDAHGAPVVVTLQNLKAPPQSQRGTGPIRLSYQVTPQDVQRSALWVVNVGLADGGAPRASASGSVMVKHPPADLSIVRTQTEALTQQARADRERLAQAADAERAAAFRQHKAKFEQEQHARRSAERARNQPLIDQIRARAGSMIRSRGLDAPVIDHLNKNRGQPTDQVIVYGKNFGAGGEVLFELGPNLRGTGVVEAWGDTVIVVDVPDASGLLQFDAGSISIVVGPNRSNAVPFQFIPAQGLREIHSTHGDLTIAQPGTAYTGPTAQYDRVDHDNTTFMKLGGNKGNDSFFPNSRLYNGWKVQEIRPRSEGCGTPFCTGVALESWSADNPYFNIRWWYNALADLRYSFAMWIVGPRGLPDGILVAGPLQPVIPPGTPAPAGPVQAPIMTAVPLDPSLLPPVKMAPPANSPPSGGQSPTQESPQVTVVPLDPSLLNTAS